MINLADSPLDLSGRYLTAGVDEAGRGPLAGPVVAAAVILEHPNPILGLADSKTLSGSKRELLADQIRKDSRAWALGVATVEEIDQMNILQATLLAMRRAVESLSCVPEWVLVDGNQSPAWKYPTRTVVRGDALIPAISAASILAKVARDTMMLELDGNYPEYGFSRHKGYPTATHLKALEIHGISPVHRKSFGPVRRRTQVKKTI
ncbi:MAG TPA: ribonuclease HII [Gammaproteobacteria bacterium]|nr:ribonuclease HII [Gammaproteobacteria bacterium]